MVFDLYYGDHLSTLSGISDCAASDFSSRVGVRVAPFIRGKKYDRWDQGSSPQ